MRNFDFAGDTHSSFEPRKIEALCRKGIVDIAFGSGPHVLAVTSGTGLCLCYLKFCSWLMQLKVFNIVLDELIYNLFLFKL